MSLSRLPNEIKLKIFGMMDLSMDQIFNLRLMPRNDSPANAILLSDEIGHDTLVKYESHHPADSICAPLTKFDTPDDGKKLRTRKEMLYWQHRLGRPCKQIVNKQLKVAFGGKAASIHAVLKGGYFAFVASNGNESEVIVYNLSNTIFFSLKAFNDDKEIHGITLCERFITYVTSDTIYVCQLRDLAANIVPDQAGDAKSETVFSVAREFIGDYKAKISVEPVACLAASGGWVAVIGMDNNSQPCVHYFSPGVEALAFVHIPELGNKSGQQRGLLTVVTGAAPAFWIFIADKREKGMKADKLVMYQCRETKCTKSSINYDRDANKLYHDHGKQGIEIVPTGLANTWQIVMPGRKAQNGATEIHAVLVQIKDDDVPRLQKIPSFVHERIWKGMTYTSVPDAAHISAMPRHADIMKNLGWATFTQDARHKHQQVFVNDSFLVHFTRNAGSRVVKCNGFTFDEEISPPRAQRLKGPSPNGYSWKPPTALGIYEIFRSARPPKVQEAMNREIASMAHEMRMWSLTGRRPRGL